MEYETRHPDFAAVIVEGAVPETVGTGYLFTEGPAWHPHERHLTFSDIAGDTMYRWHWRGGTGGGTSGGTGGAPEVFRRPSRKANGNTYDAEGRLLTCEHAVSRLVREGAGGGLEVLASHYAGRELNSPNDVIVAHSGAIWFTDPLAGRRPFFGIPRAQELDFQGLWRIPPEGGEAEPVVRDFELPNGLCLSPDERVLYVNDTSRAHIRRFDHGPDGRLSGGEVFARLEGDGEGVADGMKTDLDGRVWCTGPGGVHVFSPEGTCLGVLRLPQKTANFTWGGPERRTLFTTSSTSVYSLEVGVAGNALF